MELKRRCPKCNEIISYQTQKGCDTGNNKNSLCRSCSKKGKLNPNFEHDFSNDHRQKLSDAAKIVAHKRAFSELTKNKLSATHKGKNNPFYGREHTDATKRKMRLSHIKRIEDRYGTIFPNYNINAISIIEQKAKELGITDLQHAENGGEFYIKELGYWVDGYSEEKNIVIEYYEPFHKRQVERDLKRKQEIINFLGCEFVELKSWRKENVQMDWET